MVMWHAGMPSYWIIVFHGVSWIWIWLLPAIRTVSPSFCHSPLHAPWPSHCRRCPESHPSSTHPRAVLKELPLQVVVGCGDPTTPCLWQQESNNPVQEGISCPQGLLAIWTSRNVTQSSLVLKWSLCRKTFGCKTCITLTYLQDSYICFVLRWPNILHCHDQILPVCGGLPNLHTPVTILEAR